MAFRVGACALLRIAVVHPELSGADGNRRASHCIGVRGKDLIAQTTIPDRRSKQG